MKPNHLKRREFIAMGMTGFALFASSCVPAGANGMVATQDSGRMSSLGKIGLLRAPDANGVRLPPGFKSRIVARSGERASANSDYVWHPAPDGGATYETLDGWIYVSNAEVRNGAGGVGALRFNSRAEVVDSYSILSGTSINCAGGKTPWQTWLSCEEFEQGQVYECDPFGIKPAELRPALGTFKHEAVAVDPVNGMLYLTEDWPDGGFYRFRPANNLPDLDSGVLEIARLVSNAGRNYLDWVPVPDPLARQVPTRQQVPDYAPFNGGEGLVYHNGTVYFSTKGDNRVWCYDTTTSAITVLYDKAASTNPILSGVDNLSITPAGEVLVAEDNGDMQIVLLLPDEKVLPLLQIVGQDQSEITGPAFDPSFQRLYFSSQRGPGGTSANGLTYEISVET